MRETTQNEVKCTKKTNIKKTRPPWTTVPPENGEKATVPGAKQLSL